MAQFGQEGSNLFGRYRPAEIIALPFKTSGSQRRLYLFRGLQASATTVPPRLCPIPTMAWMIPAVSGL